MFSHFILCLFRFFGWGGEDDDFFQRLADKVFEKLLLLQGSLAQPSPYNFCQILANIWILPILLILNIAKYLKPLLRIFFPSVFRLTSPNIWHCPIKNRLFRIIAFVQAIYVALRFPPNFTHVFSLPVSLVFLMVNLLIVAGTCSEDKLNITLFWHVQPHLHQEVPTFQKSPALEVVAQWDNKRISINLSNCEDVKIREGILSKKMLWTILIRQSFAGAPLWRLSAPTFWSIYDIANFPKWMMSCPIRHQKWRNITSLDTGMFVCSGALQIML